MLVCHANVTFLSFPSSKYFSSRWLDALIMENSRNHVIRITDNTELTYRPGDARSIINKCILGL